MTFSSDRDWPSCACGCGQPVPARKASNPSKGWKIGDPCRFVAGHSSRPQTRQPINGLFRCGKCGLDKPADDYHKDSTRPHGIYIHCKACQSDRARKRYVRDREEILKRTAAYNKANPEVTSGAMKRYRATKQGAIKARANASNYRARVAERFVESIDPAVVFQRSKGLCGICGGKVDPENFHVDHRIPLARGGEHSYENVQAAHPSCNTSKRDRLESEVQLERQHKTLAAREKS